MSFLVAVVAGFASGVGVQSVFQFGWEPMVFVLLLAALLSAAAFLKERRAYALAALFCLFASLGMLRTLNTSPPIADAFSSDLRHRVSYEGIVTGNPDIREKNQRIPLQVYSGESRAGVLAVMPLSAHVAVGDRVRVYGTLLLPQAFETEEGRTFRYDKYLEVRGIQYLIQFGSIYTEAPAPWYSLPAALAKIKHSFLDGLARAVPEPASALAGGIVIGGKSGLGTELHDAFVRAGLVQIIVLSGYNVMIVAEWVMAALALLLLPRRIQFFAGGAALLLFIGIAGISATAVRAAIMAVIALYARATGRSYAASRALLVTVLLMLVWNPLYLVFDPGFGLSVAATAGIIWLSPIIESWLEARRKGLLGVMPSAASPSGEAKRSQESFSSGGFWINVVATTLAAQVAVLPLLLYNTGLLSLVALPANIMVSPLVPLTMAAAAIAGIVGMTIGPLVPVLATVAGLPAHFLTSLIIFITTKAASLPFSALILPPFPFLFVLLGYALLVYIASSKRFSITDQFKFAKNAST